MSPKSMICLHLRCVADWKPVNARIEPIRIVCCIECGEQTHAYFIKRRHLRATFKNGVTVTLVRPNFTGPSRRQRENLC